MIYKVLFTLFLVGLVIKYLLGMQRKARERYIDNYQFPPGLYQKLATTYPQLNEFGAMEVARGLRQFFRAYLHGNFQHISMPSKVVDELWHEFILHTRDYLAFCDKAYGQTLHHTPSAQLGSRSKSNEGLRRVWRLTCQEEGINLWEASRLPLLFSLDAKYNIPNGYYYLAFCAAERQANSSGDVHCGSDFASSSFDGGTVGLGSDSSSDSGGNGGGDGGGSSCGGGCGGD